MALTNFIITVAGVGTAVLLMRSDVRQSAMTFRRNVRPIRNWLKEESTSVAMKIEKAKPKVIPAKDFLEEEKH